MRKGTAFRKHKATRVNQCEKVLNLIKDAGKITTYDLYKVSGMKHESVAGRLADLEQAGLIYQSGAFVPEIGRPCTIWKATPAELVEARKVENWNKRLVLWLEKGKRNGFVTAKELNVLKKQSSLF